MNKINIKDLEIEFELSEIIEYIKKFDALFIDINSNISSTKNVDSNLPIVFANEELSSFKNSSDIKQIALELFSAYKPTITGTKCKIKPLMNWQDIIELNKKEMLYYDHQSDGVEIFEDSILEDYGWNASALEINYREISEFIETNCEGTLLYYDNEIQFNGFCLVDSLEDTRQKVKSFIVNKAKENLQNDVIELDDDDVVEALEFFEIKV